MAKLDNYEFPIKKNTSNSLCTKFYTLNSLSSNLKSDTKIGHMSISYENKILCSMDICLKNELKQNSWHYYFIKILKEFKDNFIY